jgi:hypothetical protein
VSPPFPYPSNLPKVLTSFPAPSHYRALKPTILLPLTCLLTTAAFATRALPLSSSATDANSQIYTASALLHHTSPPLFLLSAFPILGRLYHYVPYFASMHPARMMLTFGCVTGVIELLMIMGVAFVANRGLREKQVVRGEYMERAGVVVQLMVAGLFYAQVGMFGWCCWKGGIWNGSRKVRRLVVVLCGGVGLLMVRAVCAAVERFNSGEEGPWEREWWFYVLDGGLLLVYTVGWNVWHPGRYLPESERRYLAQDGKTELQGPGWKDSRSMTETFMDPFAALTARGGHKKPFWEHNGYALKRRRR